MDYVSAEKLDLGLKVLGSISYNSYHVGQEYIDVMVCVARGQVVKALDPRSRGLGFDSGHTGHV